MTDKTPSKETAPDASAEAQPSPVETPTSEQPGPPGRQGVPAWAVISGAAAAGLIVVAGVGGYAIGQANANSPRDLARVEAGAPMQPGGPIRPEEPGERDGRGPDGRDGRGDGDRGHHEEPWEQDGSHEWMGPQDDFDMRGPMQAPMPDGMLPQGISPQDLQQLLDLLMQSSGGRMPFDGQMDGQDGGQWGAPHGYSQGS